MGLDFHETSGTDVTQITSRTERPEPVARLSREPNAQMA